MKKLILITATLLAGLTATAQDRQIVDGIVAVVGQTIIKNSDVEQAYAQIRLRKGMENAKIERCALLENMLISKLLVHKGMVDSVEVKNEQVEEQVEYYLDMAVAQAGGKEKLRNLFHASYDELHDQYFDILYERMLSQKVEYDLTGNIKVTPAEVTEYFAKYTADSLPEIPTQYEVSEIVIEPTISEAERERVRSELAELRERILKGDNFAMLARLYSQDPGSASKGGELGFFGRDKMVSEFEAAAFALKPGEVSPIVETQFGFHIIQLIERRGVTLDTLAQEIRQGHATFEEVARKYSNGVSREQGGAVTNPSTGNSRFDKETFSQLYPGISIAAMDEGEISNATPITTTENKSAYCIVKVTKRIAAHKANLTDDYDRISNAALEAAKNQKIVDWCNRMVKTTYVRIADDYKDCPNFKVNWPR